ncbi:cytochrome c oxidase assembly protein CtaG/Cox11-domain-containing protein [Mycena floridula]|nr:cytochrome c oxidase assembly protein CtaG/Cox11-domain-containing protein [Mycena floridula]
MFRPPICRAGLSKGYLWPRFNSTTSRQRARQELYKERNRSLLMYSSAVIVAAVGVTYAAVPLYRIFCSATGFAGTPKVSSTASGRFDPERLTPETNARRIKVHFNADRSESLPWTFRPSQRTLSVLPGESSLAFYTAKNQSDKDIIGIATYNVTPDRVAPYFSKVECFCFEEQKLLAGEEIDMPLLFFIDKDMLDDPACRNVDDVVLSYTFFRARRNKRGQLEPDAADDKVQQALGFGSFVNAPRVEDRKEKE